MAVEARHLTFFNNSREIMNGIDNIHHQFHIQHQHQNAGGVVNLNSQMDFGLPLSGTTAETLLPFYNSVVVDSVPPVKAESGLTYNYNNFNNNNSNNNPSRKRSRDQQQQQQQHPIHQIPTNSGASSVNNTGFTFMGEDISFQIQQHQIEIDRFINHHTEKLLLGVAERRKNQTRRLVAAIEEGISRRLRAKEEEIEKMGKLNWVLEDRIRNLCIENQIWRELAQTNEATANALRANLEQVLSKVRDDRTAEADDAASSCGSSDVLHRDPQRDCDHNDEDLDADHKKRRTGMKDRWCRNCGEMESCVLLLPCSHLCLCGVCGPTLRTCPICKSDMNGTVNVNMS